jgi:hypothetical protein
LVKFTSKHSEILNLKFSQWLYGIRFYRMISMQKWRWYPARWRFSWPDYQGLIWRVTHLSIVFTCVIALGSWWPAQEAVVIVWSVILPRFSCLTRTVGCWVYMLPPYVILCFLGVCC